MTLSVAARPTIGWADARHPVTTDLLSLRLGTELRAELVGQDHGLARREGVDPARTATLGMAAANLKVQALFNPRSELALQFDLLGGRERAAGGAGGFLTCGYGTYWVSRILAVSLGQQKVLQGGWDSWNRDVRSLTRGVYAENLVFQDYEPMLAVQLRVAGEARLQVLNDVRVGEGGEWSKTRHGTWVAGWMGRFGPLRPLITMGSYDNNHSRWLDLGVMAEVNALTLAFDVYSRRFVHKDQDPENPGQTEAHADSLHAVTASVRYQATKRLAPFAQVSRFENHQATDPDIPARRTVRVNATPGDEASGVAPRFDDNGRAWAAGLVWATREAPWAPYLVVSERGGRFARDPAAPEEGQVFRKELTVRAGIWARTL